MEAAASHQPPSAATLTIGVDVMTSGALSTGADRDMTSAAAEQAPVNGRVAA